MQSPFKDEDRFAEEICVLIDADNNAIVATEDLFMSKARQLDLLEVGRGFKVGIYRLVEVEKFVKCDPAHVTQ